MLLGTLAFGQTKKPTKKKTPVKKGAKAPAKKSTAKKPATKQPPKEIFNDFQQIVVPKLQYTGPDTASIIEEEIEGGEDSDEGSEEEQSIFSPNKKPTLVSEDTSDLADGELSIVEVEEQVRFADSTWVKIAEYYSIWDSRAVNPYRIDATKFKDTVAINLYDSLQGRNFHPPLRHAVINSDFGMRWSRFHYGVDLDLNIGDSIFAVFDGIVRISKYDRNGYGNYVMLRHYNGLETLYGHMTKQAVSPGQYVKAGDFIGFGGSTGRSTGPHLHFEVRFEGNAIDPEHFFDFEKNLLRDSKCEITSKEFAYLKVARQVMYHRVRSGENLGIIARRYRVPVMRICKLNRISTRTVLRVGRKLRIK